MSQFRNVEVNAWASGSPNRVSPLSASEDSTSTTPMKPGMAIKIRASMILSFVIDTALLIVSVLVVPSYQAVTRDTFLNNGTLQSTEDFVRAREPSDVENSQKSASEAGICIAYFMAVVCVACLITDVWCFLTAQTVYNPRLADGLHDCNFDPLFIWIGVSGLLFIVGIAQVKILTVVLLNQDEQGGGSYNRRGRKIQPTMALYMFPEDVDYSLESDEWKEAVTGLKIVLYATLACTINVVWIRNCALLPFVVRLKYGARASPDVETATHPGAGGAPPSTQVPPAATIATATSP